MKMTKHVLLALCLIHITAYATAQQLEIYSDDEYLYKTEITGGINWNTNGGMLGGAVFRYSWAKKPTVYRNLSLEIVNVKHPKEQRSQSAIGSLYVFGKVNRLLFMRPQYGMEHVLFRKSNEKGAQINVMASAGPTIGIVAPYLIVYLDPITRIETEEQYNPDIHRIQSNITKTGSLANSFAQSNFEIGASFKTSMTMEFGTFKSNVSGVELGFMVDLFPEEITILDALTPVQNRNVFTSAFINVYFGTRR
jgi:hypothetical protein